MNLHDVPETNVGPDQQDTAHALAHEHAEKVAAQPGVGRLADVTPLTEDEVDDLVADYFKNGSVAVAHVGVERVLATIVHAKLEDQRVAADEAAFDEGEFQRTGV